MGRDQQLLTPCEDVVDPLDLAAGLHGDEVHAELTTKVVRLSPADVGPPLPPREVVAAAAEVGMDPWKNSKHDEISHLNCCEPIIGLIIIASIQRRSFSTKKMTYFYEMKSGCCLYYDFSFFSVLYLLSR